MLLAQFASSVSVVLYVSLRAPSFLGDGGVSGCDNVGSLRYDPPRGQDMYTNRVKPYLDAMAAKKAPSLTYNAEFHRNISPIIQKRIAASHIDKVADFLGVSRKSIENMLDGLIPSKNKSRKFDDAMANLDLDPAAAKRGKVVKLPGPPAEQVAELIADMRTLPNWPKLAEQIKGLHSIALGTRGQPTG